MPNHLMEAEELMAYLDGELSPDRAATAAQHLERCRECQELAADFESVSRRMLAWQVEPVANKPASWIVEALNEPKPVRKPRRVWLWAGGLAATAAAVLLFVARPLPPHQLAEKTAVASYPAPSQFLPQFEQLQPAGQQGGQQQSRPADTANERSPFGAPRPAPVPMPQAPMIARTVQLTLTSRDVDQARNAIEDILKRHGGYLGGLTANSPAGAGRTLEATLRIPADHLQAGLAELKKLGRVESESQTGEEVTQQAVDLDARLANSRNTEERLTALLRQQSGRLTDVLQVERELDRVRGEIERMESERKALAKRVDYATVNVTLSEDYKANLQLAPDSELTRFRNAAVEGFRNVVDTLSGLALWLLAYGPSILLWGAILFFPVRLAWKKWSNRKAGASPGATPL